MNPDTMSPAELRRAGLEALTRALGPVGMVRLLQQFDKGSGDYSKDRHTWLKDEEIGSLVEEVRRKREPQPGP